MITKQQALEFIYELSKRHKIKLDLSYGYIGVDGSDEDGWNFSAYADESLEATVTQLIKENLNPYSILLEYVDFPIPVDIDMLEVGQTYKVELDDFYDGGHSVHVAKYIGEKEGYYYFKNRHTWRYEKKDLYQLWKMNNKENEVTNENKKTK